MRLLQHLLTGLIRLYRWLVSPVLTRLFNPNGLCRFNPSCSEYALQAVQRHGAFRGSWLAGKRILRCNPWGSFGFDPVPPKQGEPAGCSCAEPVHSSKTETPARPAELAGGSAFAPRPTSL